LQFRDTYRLLKVVDASEMSVPFSSYITLITADPWLLHTLHLHYSSHC